MSEQLFYVEDTVSLKTAATKIGSVDRTVGQIETHVPSPEDEYVDGIACGRGISKRAFESFLSSGIPPRGSVLVTWYQLPWQYDRPSALVLERDLTLLDRSLLAGDIVKRSSRDEMSGTVIQTKSYVSLLRPLKWRDAQGLVDSGTDLRANSTPTPRALLRDIPSEDLTWATDYHEQDFIIYKDWVGKVTDVEEEVHLRLKNNSVVVPEDYEGLELADSEGYCQTGEYISTKKANLRRGRWIYGAYNARIEPEGFIADIRPQAIGVEWLVSRYPTGGTAEPPAPPDELELDDLRSGEVHLYDRRRRSGNQLRSDASRLNLELMPGDKVRFRDLAGAVVKYSSNALTADGTVVDNRVIRIPREDSLGYDINVYIVVSTKTTVDVAWQDGTISLAIPSEMLVPYEVFDAEEELWPGDMVITKVNASGDESLFKAERVGIVQRVDARDRLVKVKWIPGAELFLTVGEEPTLLPGSHTGQAEGPEEEVSQYDIVTVAGLPRRRGDFVAIVPSPSSGTGDGIESLNDVRVVLSEPANSTSWFGEIVHLGLDGLLTIRLAAATPVRDVRVPWECTHLVWSSDEESLDPVEDYESESEAVSAEDDEVAEVDGVNTTSTTSDPIATLMGTVFGRFANNTNFLGGQDEQPTEGDGEDAQSSVSWETEDEDDAESDEDMQENTNISPQPASATEEDVELRKDHDTSMDGTSDGSLWPALAATPAVTTSTFSYSSMFIEGTSRPETFAILDGAPPVNHPWAEANHTMSGKVLRRLHKEHEILTKSLPDGTLVRTWESSLDCMRILLLGPLGTPYEYAPFIFDLYLDSSFPSSPPRLFFHSWTDGQGPCNPNLYEDGKVCLSLLGTWPGDDKGESWTSNSTILQIIVSLLGLVLVSEPYYNEAGYEIRKGTVETRIPSSLYSERTFLRTRSFISRALCNPIGGFDEPLKSLYLSGPNLLARAIDSAIDIVNRSRTRRTDANPDDRTMSPGALIPLIRQIDNLITGLQTSGRDTTDVRQALQAARGLPSAT